MNGVEGYPAGENKISRSGQMHYYHLKQRVFRGNVARGVVAVKQSHGVVSVKQISIGVIAFSLWKKAVLLLKSPFGREKLTTGAFMKQDDTKRQILDKALQLFSERGYDAVSVGEIAKEVGIKAPSLYNHFQSKQAIFEAIVAETDQKYDRDTDKIDIHVKNGAQDAPSLQHVSAEELLQKLRGIFLYSLHDEKVARFRKMMTIEQFRSSALAELYSQRYVDRIVFYHAEIFRKLIMAGEILAEDPQTLALLYVSPVVILLGVCDRQPEREAECLVLLESHVRLFFRTYNIAARGGKK